MRCRILGRTESSRASTGILFRYFAGRCLYWRFSGNLQRNCKVFFKSLGPNPSDEVQNAHRMACFGVPSLPNSSHGCNLVSDKWAGAHFFVGEAPIGGLGLPGDSADIAS